LLRWSEKLRPDDWSAAANCGRLTVAKLFAHAFYLSWGCLGAIEQILDHCREEVVGCFGGCGSVVAGLGEWFGGA
jgi:hypothetical protein